MITIPLELLEWIEESDTRCAVCAGYKKKSPGRFPNEPARTPHRDSCLWSAIKEERTEQEWEAWLLEERMSW